MSSKPTRYQKIIIHVYMKERTVPRTIKALEAMTGEKYRSHSFVRDVIHRYRNAIA
jgi:hypothetical protein